jgi:TonB family protein
MIIPDKFMKLEDKEVTIFFTVTKEGKVLDPFFKEKYESYYQTEAKRLLKYFLFEPAKQSNVILEAYGSLTFNFAPSKYKSWIKERNKYKVTIDKPQDTTFTIYEIADKSPEFYKGDDALAEFILSNIEYPNVAKTQNIEGTVNLSFIVETNGFVSNVKVLKGVGGGCSEEAVRVVNLLRWKPAEKNGQYVRYKMNYPITFNLKIVNKDATNNQ